MAEKAFSILSRSIKESLPASKKSWRESLRARLSADEIHELIAGLAEGKAWQASLPDGSCCVPVVPSSDVRLRALMFLHEALYGKAVAQTEIIKAEQEAKDFEAVRALSDEELDREAAKIIEARRVPRLTKTTDAEYTVESEPVQNFVQEPSLADRIWSSTVSTGEQDDPD